MSVLFAHPIVKFHFAHGDQQVYRLQGMFHLHASSVTGKPRKVPTFLERDAVQSDCKASAVCNWPFSRCRQAYASVMLSLTARLHRNSSLSTLSAFTPYSSIIFNLKQCGRYLHVLLGKEPQRSHSDGVVQLYNAAVARRASDVAIKLGRGHSGHSGQQVHFPMHDPVPWSQETST